MNKHRLRDDSRIQLGISIISIHGFWAVVNQRNRKPTVSWQKLGGLLDDMRSLITYTQTTSCQVVNCSSDSCPGVEHVEITPKDYNRSISNEMKVRSLQDNTWQSLNVEYDRVELIASG
jgi:hypothetical protein